jgi:hypothetical protein
MLSFFSEVQDIARASFIDGTVDVLRLAAIMLAFGALAALILVRSSDLIGYLPEEAGEAKETTGRGTKNQ